MVLDARFVTFGLQFLMRTLHVQHQQPAPVPEVSEEDEIQKAIALSLEGGAGLGLGGVSSGGGAESGGWGGRLAEQEREEEQRYKEEAEKAVREEVILPRIQFGLILVLIGVYCFEGGAAETSSGHEYGHGDRVSCT